MYFEIQADDVDRAAAFYTDIFEWTIHHQEAMPAEYRRVATSGINGGILKRPMPRPGSGQGTNAAVISMEVEDFDSTAAAIVASGGAVSLPKFAVPGRCWQGYFIDTEGNTFGIFEVDLHAA